MTYFVSDVHGQYELFIRLLEKIGFSDKDEMYVLGDMIDKGKGSIRLLKYVMGKPNIHCIMGNHEYRLLYEYHSIMEDSPTDFSEVLTMLQNHFAPEDDPLTFEVLDWLECLPYYIEGEDFIAVHAGVPADEENNLIDPADALPEQLIYDRAFKKQDYIPKSEKCVIFGHTPTVYICGKPIILAYKKKGKTGKTIDDYCKIHIDTDTWESKVLGCLCKEKLTVTYVKG